MESPKIETMVNPTLSTTSAAAGNRSASPPLGGGIRDGAFAAAFGALAAQAAGLYCASQGMPAEMCAQVAGVAATAITALVTGGLGFVFTFGRKWWADKQVKHSVTR